MRVTRSRMVAVLALALAGVLALGLVLAVNSGFRSVPSAAPSDSTLEVEWKQRFTECTGGRLTPALAYSEPVRECVYEVLTDAVDAGELVSVQRALHAQIESDPLFFYSCHQAGHRAGEYAFEQRGDVPALLEQTSDTCLFAVGHGVLDGFALTSPSDESFVAAAESCLSVLDDPAGTRRMLCLDGMGHVAWSSTRDFPEAASRCELIPDGRGQTACMEGVLMQIFEPAALEPELPLTVAPVVIPGLCRSLASSDRDIHVGCHRGAGYVYTRAVRTAASDWESTAAPGARLSRSAGREIVDAMLVAADWCSAHRDADAVDACMGSASMQTPDVLLTNPVLLREGCAPHTNPEWKSLCMQRIHTPT